MKIVQINATCDRGSTGMICVQLSHLLTRAGVENYILYSGSPGDLPQGRRYAPESTLHRQALRARLNGRSGFNSQWATRHLLAQLDALAPEVVHLHNLHSHNCHLGMLLDYLKRKKIRTIWTFHDCWAFTGYCPHFDMALCDRWMSGCGHCPQKRKFSWTFDRSAQLFQQKKAAMDGLDLTVVVPSRWMERQVARSFLSDRPVHLIPNSIDLTLFRPTDSDFRERYDCREKKIILGVADRWGRRKGLDVFLALAGQLPDNWQILLVGTDRRVDRRLPDNILSIHKTRDPSLLAQIYSTADVFVNPTLEDTSPTVNMEALACGTPVVTFDTGGSGEMVDESCGAVVPRGDIPTLRAAIGQVLADGSMAAACRARAQQWDREKNLGQYLQLYEVENGKR